jgi:ubiquitin-hydrolase Zn-finger-containing protein
MASCSHLDAVKFIDAPDEVAGCEECLATGGWWVHLRMCQTCEHIGCCDNSPNRHATAHHHASGHPIIRSVEPGEDWSWCYVDELMLSLARG